MASITLRAFAKINLSLRVSSARADGFHDVRTILQAIDLFDRVKCEARRGPFQIRCDMPGVPTDRTNLVWKAAQLLWEAAERSGEPRNTVVTLQKNIPMKAGLGGGSSNAAAALLGLRRLWKLRVPDEQIHALAARLGSDVPFFLVGGTALGLGRGEEVYPLENLPRISSCAGDPAVRGCDERRICVAGREKAPGAFFDRRTGKRLPEPFRHRDHVVPAGNVARPYYVSRQRSGGSGDGSTPRDRSVEATVYGARRVDGGDVGQRLDGVRRVQVSRRPPTARRAR